MYTLMASCQSVKSLVILALSSLCRSFGMLRMTRSRLPIHRRLWSSSDDSDSLPDPLPEMKLSDPGSVSVPEYDWADLNLFFRHAGRMRLWAARLSLALELRLTRSVILSAVVVCKVCLLCRCSFSAVVLVLPPLVSLLVCSSASLL